MLQNLLLYFTNGCDNNQHILHRNIHDIKACFNIKRSRGLVIRKEVLKIGAELLFKNVEMRVFRTNDLSSDDESTGTLTDQSDDERDDEGKALVQFKLVGDFDFLTSDAIDIIQTQICNAIELSVKAFNKERQSLIALEDQSCNGLIGLGDLKKSHEEVASGSLIQTILSVFRQQDELHVTFPDLQGTENLTQEDKEWLAKNFNGFIGKLDGKAVETKLYFRRGSIKISFKIPTQYAKCLQCVHILCKNKDLTKNINIGVSEEVATIVQSWKEMTVTPLSVKKKDTDQASRETSPTTPSQYSKDVHVSSAFELIAKALDKDVTDKI